MGSWQSLENLPILLPPSSLTLFAGQHQVGIEVVGDQGGGQVPEVELEHGGDAVDVVEQGGVPGQVGHPLIVEQVSGDGDTQITCHVSLLFVREVFLYSLVRFVGEVSWLR